MNLELFIDSEYFSLSIYGLWPNGVGIEIPTWLLVGTIALVYSIVLIRRDK
jgi:hypothetical protein